MNEQSISRIKQQFIAQEQMLKSHNRQLLMLLNEQAKIKPRVILIPVPVQDNQNNTSKDQQVPNITDKATMN